MSIIQRAYSSRAVIRTILCNKIKRAEVAKRIQKENKVLFGALVETKKQKVARERREKKKKYSSANDPSSSVSTTERNKSQLDPEHLWILGTNEKRLSQIRFKKYSIPTQTKTIIKITQNSETSTDYGDEALPVSLTDSPTEVECTKQNLIVKLNARENNDEKKDSRLPSDILVRKMTLFSYLDDSKDETTCNENGGPQSISASSDKSKLFMPSVTKILNKTMSEASKLNLELWKQRMIAELGVEGFAIYSQELLLHGKRFHSSIQNYLTQKPFDVPEAVAKSWQSVQHVLKDVDGVRAIESHVVHQKLFYRGIVDCVACYKGNLCVIDWKKSDKPKTTVDSTFDAPIQVASYIGAINSDCNYKFQVRNGLVIVAYTNGDPATIHEVNPTLLNKYWKLWLRRLQRYYLDVRKSEQDSSSGNEQ